MSRIVLMTSEEREVIIANLILENQYSKALQLFTLLENECAELDKLESYYVGRSVLYAALGDIKMALNERVCIARIYAYRCMYTDAIRVYTQISLLYENCVDHDKLHAAIFEASLCRLRVGTTFEEIDFSGVNTFIDSVEYKRLVELYAMLIDDTRDRSNLTSISSIHKEDSHFVRYMIDALFT